MSKSPSSAETAVGPMVIAAMEQHLPAAQRIVDDPMAIRMLPRSSAAIVALCKWAPLRRLLVRLSEAAAPGVWGGVLGRKRYLHDLTRQYLAEAKGPIVVLGAGLDTKGLQLAVPAGRDTYEIDQAENISLKQRALRRAFGEGPSRLHLIAVDFEQADLNAELARAGFDGSEPALYIWEGVTQYLTRPAVERTMEFLSSAAPGSRLAFTFVLADFVAGQDVHGSAAIYRRLVEGHRVWHSGLAPEDIPAFLGNYGWQQLEQAGHADYAQYLVASNRQMDIMQIERVVLAEKAR